MSRKRNKASRNAKRIKAKASFKRKLSKGLEQPTMKTDSNGEWFTL